jgi:hypothetical protein
MSRGSTPAILQMQREQHPEMNFQNQSNEELIQKNV